MSDCERYPKLSVVIPCRNERHHIGQCIRSVLENGYPGALEVIVVDGLSEDGTLEAVREAAGGTNNVIILNNPKRAAPSALNIGIRAASGELVALVGAHTRLEPGYLKRIVADLLSNQQVGCVGGQTVARSTGRFVQDLVAKVLSSPFGVGNSYFRLPGSVVREVDTVAYGVYRRSIFDQIGYFDESLVRNQDIELNSRLRRAGYRIILDPSVEVTYYPRASVRDFLRQSFANGLWNIKTWRRSSGSLSWRHFVPLGFTVVVGLSGVLSLLSPIARGVFFLTAGVYLVADVCEALRLSLLNRHPRYLLTLLVFPILHVGYGTGSLWGVMRCMGPRRPVSSNRTAKA